ncbi:TetR/AcrR family transcriptional regulator [Williamsia serinedens]|uniref:TetR/AcrR family transcriptional regulator n=1 Tax=Williamsia serinedens TaxID=391736 RepID=UPI0020A618BB|nr:TetR/AcrR family transcriptional regulator [Williamsia serinedens]
MSTSNAVLDAARRCLVRSEGRKVTLAEVAREAGVSRPTVYRHWPEISAVIRDLLTRELAHLSAEHLSAVDDALARGEGVLDAVVAAVVRVADAVTADPLFESLTRRQPDLLAPYVFERFGASQQMALESLATRLTAAQDVGAVRRGDADRIAAMVILVAQSAITGRATVAAIIGDDWADELARVVRGYLAPDPISEDDSR